MRSCLPLGKCYAAVITYILAGLYGKSRTGWPLAAFNHHYTLTRFLPLARFSFPLNPYSPRIKVKICTRQSGREPKLIAIHNKNQCSFLYLYRSKKLEEIFLAEHNFHFKSIDRRTYSILAYCTTSHFCLGKNIFSRIFFNINIFKKFCSPVINITSCVIVCIILLSFSLCYFSLYTHTPRLSRTQLFLATN